MTNQANPKPDNVSDFNALLSANQATYRRNTIVQAVDNFCKLFPDAVEHFQNALVEISEQKFGAPDDAAEG